MDYIQKDLDMIRMAASSNESESSVKKPKQKQKKEKPVKKQRITKVGDDSSQTSSTKPAKQRSKKLSLEKIDKERNKKEKAVSRKSLGGVKNSPALGKIKLPSMKKQTPTPQKETAAKATKRKLSVETKPALSPIYVPKADVAPKIMTTPVGAARSKKNLDPDAIPIEAIRFEEGAKIEAVDHGQWYKAKIVKVDQDKMDILVHFDGWGARFDTWFPMTSTLIRGRTQLDTKADQPRYESGEDVLAKWLDENFYPATVLSVKASGSCMVMYFDGMKKLLRPNMMKKMSEKEKETAMKAVEKMLLLPPSVGSPQSSISAGSPSSAEGSTFRRYRTSANDRERRIAARSERHDPKGKEGKPVKKRALKRKAAEIETEPTAGILPPDVAGARTSRHSSDDENFIAKKARLDRITDSLLDRVSPTSDSSSKKDSAEVRDMGASPGLIESNDDGESDSDSPLVIDEESEAQYAKKRKIKKKSKSEHVGSQGAKMATKAKTAKPQPHGRDDVLIPDSGELGMVTGRHFNTGGASSMDKKAANQMAVSQMPVDKTEQDLSGNDPSQSQVRGTAGASITPEDDQAKNEEAPMKTGNWSEVQTESQTEEKGTTAEATGVAKISAVYKKGDIVLAKWADCRSYLAYVIKKEDDDNYKIRYYDGMIKIVKSSFIHPWVGPLPDALKSFKPKSPPKPKRRRKSSDSKQIRKKKEVKTDPKKQTAKAQTAMTSTADPMKTSRRRSRTSSDGGVPLDIIQYSPAERVLAKWTDLKWYPAMVVCQTDNDHYKVKYHDDLTRIVRDTWLTPWKPPSQADVKPAEPVSVITPQFQQSPKQEDVFKTPLAEHVTEDVAAGTSKMYHQDETSTKLDSKENKPEEGSIIEAGEVVGLGEQSIKTYEKFNMDDTVLARWTDCRSYPATVKKVLEDGRYVVEYYDGMQRELKPAMLKSWNPSAMPPAIRPRKPRKAAPATDTTTDATSTQLRGTRLATQGKNAGRQAPKQPANLPRQVVRGYDAYYARLPAAKEAIEADHHKFKCRVPGCTKSFRKEELLRQHHKYYHQQRYKLRDMETTNTAPRRKSKDDTIVRRRVSADYEAFMKGLDAPSHPLVSIKDSGSISLPSRGAKPPMDVYRKQHANISISSVSSMLDTSSGVDDSKPKEDRAFEIGKSAEHTETGSKDSQHMLPEPKISKRKRKRQSAEQSDKTTPQKEDLMQDISVDQIAMSPDEDQSEIVNEDVIRCTCGMEEEEGFMIQCEGCFTWQHGACVGVEQPSDANGSAGTSKQKSKPVVQREENMDDTKIPQEDKIAEKEIKPETGKNGAGEIGTNDSYICWVCKNPENVRKSKKYLYSNEFLMKGKLPSLMNLENSETATKDEKSLEVMMKAMHQLMDEVVKMQDTLHGIKQKIEVVSSPGEHPMLKTWKDGNDTSLQEEKSVDSMGLQVDQIEAGADTMENKVPNHDNQGNEKEAQSKDAVTKESLNPDTGTGTTKQLPAEDKGQPSVLESTQPPSTAEELATIATEKVAKKPKKKAPGRRGRSSSSEITGEDREVYIHKCRENLLNHIIKLEKMLDDRLDRLEEYFAKIDAQVGDTPEASGDAGKLREDLTAVQKLLLYC